MQKTIYYLSSCNTCRRIMKDLGVNDTWTKREIKSEKITIEELERMRELTGSYEKLFSRRSMKYKALGLKNQSLDENDYKKYILNEYTFLKRPVIIIDNKLFAGSSKKVVADAKEALK